VTLLEKLNDEDSLEELSRKFDEKLASKDFWKEQDKLLTEMEEKHRLEHESIKMTHERFIRPFTI